VFIAILHNSLALTLTAETNTVDTNLVLQS